MGPPDSGILLPALCDAPKEYKGGNIDLGTTRIEWDSVLLMLVWGEEGARQWALRNSCWAHTGYGALRGEQAWAHLLIREDGRTAKQALVSLCAVWAEAGGGDRCFQNKSTGLYSSRGHKACRGTWQAQTPGTLQCGGLKRWAEILQVGKKVVMS